MRISDWSSDVCSSDLDQAAGAEPVEQRLGRLEGFLGADGVVGFERLEDFLDGGAQHRTLAVVAQVAHDGLLGALLRGLDVGHNVFLDGPGLPGLSVGRENEREIMGNSGACVKRRGRRGRSEEHTSELQSLMRTSY